MATIRHVLLTGSSGFLGEWLLRKTPSTLRLTLGVSSRGMASRAAGEGTAAMPAPGARAADSAIADADAVLLDLEQAERCRDAVLALQPEAILHAAALADTGACERDPERSYTLNVLASEALAHAAAALGIPMLFCSTDLVFGGDKAPYAPGDPVAPLMVYGRHKAEAETRVLAACPQAQVARLPLMYGHSALSGRGMVADLVARLQRGESVSLFHDEYRSMADAADVAADLWMTLLQEPPGIYHLGGPERLSRYAFGVRVAEQHGLDASRILPVSQADVATGTPRPQDVSLVRTRRSVG